MRGPIMVRCSSPTTKYQKYLACPYYPPCSPNSKVNLPDPKKVMSEASGLCIPFSPSSCRSPHQRRPTCFGFSSPLWFCRDRQETLLHLYRLAQNPLGQALIKALENDPPTGNQRKNDCRFGRLSQPENRQNVFWLCQNA